MGIKSYILEQDRVTLAHTISMVKEKPEFDGNNQMQSWVKNLK